MKVLLKAQQISKSDHNDTRDIAQMMRAGLFKPVHVIDAGDSEAKDAAAKPCPRSAQVAGHRVRSAGHAVQLRLKVGPVSQTSYEVRIRDLAEKFRRLPNLSAFARAAR
ncbi:hypothetical protein KRR38_34400 [Novosphingobium sp. G106]|uniref:hypothetical protein n=1 Tax=Novosphingobium sp. G106 TaxID=2849500 RepID=UPI001C2CF610|nr:hypothetical protein [Novosphingobium sp. G106]MBV1692588.1 hypothetical protein [Novosphingobium sp. G106]